MPARGAQLHLDTSITKTKYKIDEILRKIFNAQLATMNRGGISPTDQTLLSFIWPAMGAFSVLTGAGHCTPTCLTPSLGQTTPTRDQLSGRYALPYKYQYNAILDSRGKPSFGRLGLATQPRKKKKSRPSQTSNFPPTLHLTSIFSSAWGWF
jgi:hypothetical protein